MSTVVIGNLAYSWCTDIGTVLCIIGAEFITGLANFSPVAFPVLALLCTVLYVQYTVQYSFHEVGVIIE